MTVQEIAIYGAGGFAREVAWLVEALDETTGEYKVVCFIEDDPISQGRLLNGIPTVSLEVAYEQYPGALVVGGIGAPKTRELVMEKAEKIGFAFGTLIHPRTERSRFVEIGAGTVICAGNILTTNIRLGRHVQINLDCTLGHDVIMDDYATLAPGVHVSGYVQLGKRVYVGTGAVIINGTETEPLVIGDDTVVGAGACVTKSLPGGITAVGVPAKALQR